MFWSSGLVAKLLTSLLRNNCLGLIWVSVSHRPIWQLCARLRAGILLNQSTVNINQHQHPAAFETRSDDPLPTPLAIMYTAIHYQQTRTLPKSIVLEMFSEIEIAQLICLEIVDVKGRSLTLVALGGSRNIKPRRMYREWPLTPASGYASI